MPEGPEVFRITERLHEQLTNRTLAKIEVISGRYQRVDPNAAGFEMVEGHRVTRVTCKGKLLVIHFNGLRGFDEVNNAILSTMGMTGDWVTDEPGLKHARIRLHFDDGEPGVVFVDQRNFGTFKPVPYAEMKRKVLELGPDILMPIMLFEAIAHPEFIERMRRFGKKQTLAEALLDQRIAAGCGNYIRADAMYLARFWPHRPTSEMTDTDLRVLWACLHTTASVSLREPHLPHAIYGQETDVLGRPVEKYEDRHGRTVWWCPLIQTEGMPNAD